VPLAPVLAVCILAIAAAGTVALLSAIRRTAEELEREVIRLGAVSEHVGVLHDAIAQSQRRRTQVAATLSAGRSAASRSPKPDR
jgi:hypothetical protein